MISSEKNIHIHEIQCQTALNKLKRKLPYSWDLNIYRGCQHGCKYCFAIYSHQYLNDEEYFNNIYVKTNIVDCLEKELKNRRWKKEIVNIGGITDSYQPLEENYQFMPAILKLLIKYKTPAIISTKSDLIIRDYNLIDELSQLTYINIAATITTLDEDIRKKIEPNGSSSLSRFKFLKEFRKTNASVGLHTMPIIPYITDGPENLEALCYYANDSNVHYMLPGTLYLRGKTRKVFLEFMEKEFPELYNNMKQLYKTGSAGKDYKDSFYFLFNKLRKKYNLNSSYSAIMKEKFNKNTDPQLSLNFG